MKCKINYQNRISGGMDRFDLPCFRDGRKQGGDQNGFRPLWGPDGRKQMSKREEEWGSKRSITP